jgi:hypothetical protein
MKAMAERSVNGKVDLDYAPHLAADLRGSRRA